MIDEISITENPGNRELSEFYRIRGIKKEDLEEKYRALRALVMIPNFPYNERDPTLYELEEQFKIEKSHHL